MYVIDVTAKSQCGGGGGWERMTCVPVCLRVCVYIYICAHLYLCVCVCAA